MPDAIPALPAGLTVLTGPQTLRAAACHCMGAELPLSCCWHGLRDVRIPDLRRYLLPGNAYLPR